MQPPPSKTPPKTPVVAPKVEATPSSQEKKIAQLEEALKATKDSYLRASADLENYKKRAMKEREELVVATSERLLRELLDVKDHLELAIDHSQSSTDVKVLHDGVTLTLKQLSQFLEKFGVTELRALGEKFDPAYHEAIHDEASEQYQPGSVMKEYQKGYLYHGRLLRAARVAVAREKKP